LGVVVARATSSKRTDGWVRYSVTQSHSQEEEEEEEVKKF